MATDNTKKSKKSKTIFVSIFAGFCLLLLVVLLSSCSDASDLRSSSFLSKYPTPKIVSVESNGKDSLSLSIEQRFISSVHKELEQLVLLRDDANGTFDDLENIDLASLDKVEEIPYFLATEESLVLSTYYFEIEIPLPDNRLAFNNAHRLTVFSQGINEVYGRSYDNNGWVISDFSPSIDIYLAEGFEVELTNFHSFQNANSSPNSPIRDANTYGFSLALEADNQTPRLDFTCGGETTKPDETKDSNCDVIFSLESAANSFSAHLTSPCSQAPDNSSFRNRTRGLYSTKSETKETLISPTTQENVYLCLPLAIKEGMAFIARSENSGVFKILARSPLTTGYADKDSEEKFKFDVYPQPGEITQLKRF